MGIVENVVRRFVAKSNEKKVPVINKDKDRIVYVLPETADKDTKDYEHVPNDDQHHIMNHGKPKRPDRPKKPKRPTKPEIPRATTPAPLHPPRHPRPALPVPPIPKDYIKPAPLVKDPSPRDDPRRWKLRRNPKPLQARVVEKWIARQNQTTDRSDEQD